MIKVALKKFAWTLGDSLRGIDFSKPLITFNARPKSGPWGGGNQWLNTFVGFLKANGWEVNYRLVPQTRVIFIINTKAIAGTTKDQQILNNITFGLEEVREFLSKHPSAFCVQRVNDSDAHRGTSTVDLMFKAVNEFASQTIFISNWLLDYHKWFDRSKPYEVIALGADENIYFPELVQTPNEDRNLRIVTHHWSPHISKGFDWYQALDGLMASGRVTNVDFTIIGNAPPQMTWKKTRLIAPLAGSTLADILREQDVYLTASRFEAAGMHLVEGLQCGLPVIFHRDGGGICETARPYGIEFSDEATLIQAIEQMKKSRKEFREKLLRNLPSQKKMNQKYLEIFRKFTNAASNRPQKSPNL